MNQINEMTIRDVAGLFHAEQFDTTRSAGAPLIVCLNYAKEDEGRAFNRTIACRSTDEILAAAAKLTAQELHVSMDYAVKIHTGSPEELNTRHGANDVHSLSFVVVDVDAKKSDGTRMLLTQGSAEERKISVTLDRHIPEWLKKSVRYIAYTGGGLQLYVVLSRPVYGLVPAKAMVSFLKNTLSQTPELEKLIDMGFTNLGSGERLPGTYNWKKEYLQANNGMPPHVELTTPARFFTNYQFQALNVEEIQARITAQEELDRVARMRPEEQHGPYVGAMRSTEVLDEIKRSVKITSIWNQGYQKTAHGPNTPICCPNKEAHQNGDQNPSASLNQREDGSEWIYCYKERRSFDVIDVLRLTKGLGFKEAIENLAARIGRQVEWSKPGLRKAEEQTVANEFDCEGFLREMGVDPKMVEHQISGDGKGSYNTLILKGTGNRVGLPVRDKDFDDPKIFKRIYTAYLHKGAPDAILSRPQLEKLWQYLVDHASSSSRADLDSPDVVKEISNAILNGVDQPTTEYLLRMAAGETATPPAWLAKVSEGDGPLAFQQSSSREGEDPVVMVDAIRLFAVVKELNYQISKPNLFQWLRRYGFKHSKFRHKGAEKWVWPIATMQLCHLAEHGTLREVRE